MFEPLLKSIRRNLVLVNGIVLRCFGSSQNELSELLSESDSGPALLIRHIKRLSHVVEVKKEAFISYLL